MDTNHLLTEVKPGILEENRETSIYWTFDYEPDQIIYFVTHADATWVFNNVNDAFSMAALIMDIKRHALQTYLDESQKHDSISTESEDTECRPTTE